VFHASDLLIWRGVAQSGLARSVWDAEAGGSNPLAPTFPLNSVEIMLVDVNLTWKRKDRR
jgi:hypothetical protein